MTGQSELVQNFLIAWVFHSLAYAFLFKAYEGPMWKGLMAAIFPSGMIVLITLEKYGIRDTHEPLYILIGLILLITPYMMFLNFLISKSNTKSKSRKKQKPQSHWQNFLNMRRGEWNTLYFGSMLLAAPIGGIFFAVLMGACERFLGRKIRSRRKRGAR